MQYYKAENRTMILKAYEKLTFWGHMVSQDSDSSARADILFHFQLVHQDSEKLTMHQNHRWNWDTVLLLSTEVMVLYDAVQCRCCLFHCLYVVKLQPALHLIAIIIEKHRHYYAAVNHNNTSILFTLNNITSGDVCKWNLMIMLIHLEFVFKLIKSVNIFIVD